jgi:hypothetical protein
MEEGSKKNRRFMESMKQQNLVKKIVFVTIILVVSYSIIHAAIPADERAALIALYEATGGDNWTDNSGWKTEPLHTDGFAMPGTEGDWSGISISIENAEEHVTLISLASKNLNGTLPPEMVNLTNLKYLRKKGGRWEEV